MRGRVTTILIGALLLTTTLASTAAAAETLTVCPNPSDEAGCEYSVIQKAVEDAEPGDTVEILAGTYEQGAIVQTDHLTISGAGQNVTILDGDPGGDRLDEYGIAVYSDHVTIQDLTVRDFGRDGVYFDGVIGFYVHRVSAINNLVYGIYAIRSEVGIVSDSYATEHPDSGFYIGETLNCECVIKNVHAAGNLIGYSGTAASHVTIRDSTFQHNAEGVVPNVLPNEPLPQTNLVVTQNVIRNNNNETASNQWHFNGLHVPPGAGVTIAGGSNNLVTDNVIYGHDLAGVAVTWLFTEPSGNRIVDNLLENGADDETVDHGPLPAEVFEDDGVDILWDGGGVNNCFEGNTDLDGDGLTFDAGTTHWDALGTLPDCSTPNAAPPSPFALGRQLSLMGYSCETGSHLEDQNECHQELV